MSKTLFSICAGLLLTFHLSVMLASGAAAATPAHRAEALLRKMTLDEKIGQLVLLTGYGATTGPTQAQQALDEKIRTGNCGSVLNVISVAQIQRLQKMAVEETRLRIPVLFGYDVIHGYQTIFPISLGEAASWDMAAIERSARVAAIEASAAGLNWTYAPMVDIARDPRWGRISEGAGEDPFLGSKVARARVRGFQGKNLDAPDTLLACVKHFAAYGAALAGRDYNTVDMSERLLREVYLPPYEAAVQEGALSVMTSFNELDGTPASANSFLLQKILRQEWGFKGFVVSDYTSINEMVAHGSAADDMEAAKQAFNAGVDMDMVGPLYLRHLKALAARGKVNTGRINASAKRILEAKFRLGLFEDPYRYCDARREARLLGAKDHLEAAYRMACDSLVLLKNDSRTLPLKTGSKIAVIGPLADSQRDLLGSWKAEGRHEDVETVLSSVKRNNTGGEVIYARGCDIASNDRSGFDPAVAAASRSDVVILVMGESWDMTGEACCRTSINLPGVQTELVRQVRETGKPLILVLMNGRPLALEEEATLVDAMLEAWLPGSEGGRAVADALFGKHNPSGKLPVTFPRNLGQVPIFYSAKNTGRPIDAANPKGAYRSFYLDSPNDPLFPFGYGLSYSAFAFSDLQLDRAAIRSGQQITVSVTVANKSETDGAEVVQLYVRDLVGSVTRPVLELKGLQKVRLKPGESRKVSFNLGEADLRFLRKDMTWGAEPGQFLALVGPNSRDLLTTKFELLEK